MFEKVTVTDAMADDMEKLRPRLKKVHIRELALNIMTMPMTQKPMWTCRRERHCSHPPRIPLQQPEVWGDFTSGIGQNRKAHSRLLKPVCEGCTPKGSPSGHLRPLGAVYSSLVYPNDR